MNKSYLILSLTILMSMRAEHPELPQLVQQLIDKLYGRKDVASICVSGIGSNQQGALQATSCQEIKKDMLHEDGLLTWYEGVSACRSREYHELVRSAEFLGVPALAGLTVNSTLNWFLSVPRPIRYPMACFAALCAHYHNKMSWYLRLSNWLDQRADQAALVTATVEQKETVVRHLEEQLRNLEHCRSQDLQPDSGYHMYHTNAYDKGQTNICSYITMQLSMPLPWLFSAQQPTERYKNRIDCIKRDIRSHQSTSKQ